MQQDQYRYSLTRTFRRYLAQAPVMSLLPGSESTAQRADQLGMPSPYPGQERRQSLLRQREEQAGEVGPVMTRGDGAPIATFNAPQPAASNAATFNYPVHIDAASIDALPSACGVYIFRGANNMALYVGRSVNLRSRVLGHLHDPDEALLVRQTQSIEFRRTAGELGARLLESNLLKALQPLHNKKLRTKRALFTLRLNMDGQPQPAQVEERAFSRADNLFGIFSSEQAAWQALDKLVEQHRLCSIATGLETSGGLGVACFGRQIRRCLGTCTGEESHEQHQERLMAALDAIRILPWPFKGAVGIVEDADGWQQVHVVDHWRYLGSLDDAHPDLPLANLAGSPFDLDSYKIIIEPFLLGALDIRPVEAAMDVLPTA